MKVRDIIKLIESSRVRLDAPQGSIAVMKKTNDILKEFRAELEKLYGKRLKNIVLYGSWARGEATEDSDIDMAVVLEGDIRPGKEIDRMIDIITDINLKYGVLLSIYPVAEIDYLNLKSPLLMNVRREGVPV